MGGARAVFCRPAVRWLDFMRRAHGASRRSRRRGAHPLRPAPESLLGRRSAARAAAAASGFLRPTLDPASCRNARRLVEYTNESTSRDAVAVCAVGSANTWIPAFWCRVNSELPTVSSPWAPTSSSPSSKRRRVRRCAFEAEQAHDGPVNLDADSPCPQRGSCAAAGASLRHNQGGSVVSAREPRMGVPHIL